MSALPVETGQTARSEFGGQSLTRVGVESASTALAAAAKATIEARYIMALQRPRNWDQVRQDILRECRRPSFANNPSAYYVKPIGKGVEGLGIRFTEVALRCMTNVMVETALIFEDEEKEIHRVTVTDLESNLTYPLDVRVSKTVERSKPESDGSFLSVRMNSYNKPVYTVRATDDDLLNKRGALFSKAQRTLALRILPGDIQDEAIDLIKHIRQQQDAADPAAARKRIIDSFAELGVKANDLVAYLGHPIDACSPAEITNLRAIYGTIRDGEATWASVMENRAANTEATSSAKGPTPTASAAAQAWPDEKFAAELPKWRKLVENGKKTPAEIVATASTKHALTDDQKRAIEALEALEAPKSGTGPGVTFAQVEEQLNKAKDRDLLSAAADLIGEVADPEQREELTALYRRRDEEFSA